MAETWDLILSWIVVDRSEQSWAVTSQKPPVWLGIALLGAKSVSLAINLKGGQITLKDDLDAKIPKGPKIIEKSSKSDKSEPSEKTQEQNKTNKYFPSFGNSIESK